MALGRLVAVSGMALGVTLGVAAPAVAAPALPIGPGSAAACKDAGGAVVEGDQIDGLQEDMGIDDDIDVGSCEGGGMDGTPILDPAAGL